MWKMKRFSKDLLRNLRSSHYTKHGNCKDAHALVSQTDLNLSVQFGVLSTMRSHVQGAMRGLGRACDHGGQGQPPGPHLDRATN